MMYNDIDLVISKKKETNIFRIVCKFQILAKKVVSFLILN